MSAPSHPGGPGGPGGPRPSVRTPLPADSAAPMGRNPTQPPGSGRAPTQPPGRFPTQPPGAAGPPRNPQGGGPPRAGSPGPMAGGGAPGRYPTTPPGVGGPPPGVRPPGGPGGMPSPLPLPKKKKEKTGESKNKIDRFLKMMNERGASDLHLSVGNPPMLRASGQIEPVRFRRLSNRDFISFIEPITPPHISKQFLQTGDADFSYEVEGLARFRVNLFMQERGYGAVFRIIPTKLMTLEQLGLPPAIRKVVGLNRGLVLVTGPTGSGKSTTLSAIINEINATRGMHIVTIEDPIEFVHPNKKSILTQREVGGNTHSFSDALLAAVREDPNLILVGEMRDLETISLALHAASTGVLVFGTLHTNSAPKTIDRIVNVFPDEEASSVRNMLGETLKAVVSQQLLRKKGGGRVAALEIMFSTPGMATIIRDGKTHQLTSMIQTGRKLGMVSMDESLLRLVESGAVEAEAALEKAIDKKNFREAAGLPAED